MKHLLLLSLLFLLLNSCSETSYYSESPAEPIIIQTAYFTDTIYADTSTYDFWPHSIIFYNDGVAIAKLCSKDYYLKIPD